MDYCIRALVDCGYHCCFSDQHLCPLSIDGTLLRPEFPEPDVNLFATIDFNLLGSQYCYADPATRLCFTNCQV